MKASFPTGGKVRPFVVVGPGLGLVMRAKEKDGTTTTDFKSDLKFMDLSLVIGGGVAVGRASIEARYDAGLRDMAKTTSSLGVALKSRTFLVLVGIGGGK